MIEKHVKAMDLNISAHDKHFDYCLKAKQTRSMATGKLSQLKEHHVGHSEIAGHIKTQTVGKENFILTFIVEKSRLSKVYMLGERSDLHDYWIQLVVWLEREMGVTVKRSHSDQAKEYASLRDHFRERSWADRVIRIYTILQ